eukprot:1394509-Amphidinium_carterae.3
MSHEKNYQMTPFSKKSTQEPKSQTTLIDLPFPDGVSLESTQSPQDIRSHIVQIVMSIMRLQKALSKFPVGSPCNQHSPETFLLLGACTPLFSQAPASVKLGVQKLP